MRDAKINGRMVTAGPDSPEVGQCPECGHQVQKRSRRRMDKTISWFYRHTRGADRDCRRKYHPTSR